MTKSFTYILMVLLLLSCGKEEMEIELVDNECDKISRYNQEQDFVEIYGDSFVFRNVQTNQQKEFKYSLSESSTVRFNDTILCTHLTYDQVTVMKFIADDSDFVSYEVSQYFDGLDNFNSGISNSSFILAGKVIQNTRYLIDNVRMSFINEREYILTYFDNQGLLQGFDDLDGNQWVLNSLSSEMFFCEVVDNLDEYKDSEEFEFYYKLQNIALVYSDGFSTTASFPIAENYINSNYYAEVSNDCPEQKLLINHTANMNLRFSFSNIYSLNITIVPQYESAQSESKYSLIRINLWYQRENTGLHDITLIVNPQDLTQQNYVTPTPYEFHDSLELNGKDFGSVYEFTRNKKSLFFNFDYGILAFTDHLDLMNYLEVE